MGFYIREAYFSSGISTFAFDKVTQEKIGKKKLHATFRRTAGLLQTNSYFTDGVMYKLYLYTWGAVRNTTKAGYTFTSRNVKETVTLSIKFENLSRPMYLHFFMLKSKDWTWNFKVQIKTLNFKLIKSAFQIKIIFMRKDTEIVYKERRI